MKKMLVSICRWVLNRLAPQAPKKKKRKVINKDIRKRKICITDHALDRLSLRAFHIWVNSRMTDDVGFITWGKAMIIDMVKNGTISDVKNGHEPKRTFRCYHNDLTIVMKEDGHVMTVLTVMNRN